MLTAGNCLIFKRYEDLRDIMEDMDKYQGERIDRDWFEECETIIEEQGIVYVMVKRHSFQRSKDKPCNAERYIEVKGRNNNKRW